MDTATNKILNKIAPPDRDMAHRAENSDGHFSQMAHNAGEKFGKLTSNLADSATRYMDTSREYVQENPAKGVAIAAVAGILAGSLFTLAMRRRN